MRAFKVVRVAIRHGFRLRVASALRENRAQRDTHAAFSQRRECERERRVGCDRRAHITPIEREIREIKMTVYPMHHARKVESTRHLRCGYSASVSEHARDSQPSASASADIVVRVAPPMVPTLDPTELRRRIISAAIVAAATGSVLVIAWSLSPSVRGFGTHQALGLPACSWPERFSIPCPSCGMTTAFAYAAKGQFLASFSTQPMGCVLALATGMAFVGSLLTLATGRTVWPVYARIWNARAAWLLGIGALLSWGYKAALMRGWIG